MHREETIDYHLKIAWQSVMNKYNQIASGYGITHAMGYVLVSVDVEKGITVSQAANILGVKTTSLSRILNSLEELGLIFRESDKLDKRQVNIFLTELGKEKQQIAKGVVRRFNEYLDTHISSANKLNFIKTCQQLNELTQVYNDSNAKGIEKS